MPEWSAQGMILSLRPHGEGNAVVNLLTPEAGRHAGLVYGYSNASKSGSLQIGNLVQAHWRARLNDQLGSFQLEVEKNPSATFLDDPMKLAGLSSCCTILESSLPEREANLSVWQASCALVEIISLADSLEDWLGFYVKWELNLLSALGFGLNLDRCAVSGLSDSLAYVSPRSGRAVHSDHAGEYADRLLVLPDFLRQDGPFSGTVSGPALVGGLTLTGHFLFRRVFNLIHKDLPQARLRLAHLVTKRYNTA